VTVIVTATQERWVERSIRTDGGATDSISLIDFREAMSTRGGDVTWGR